jgi:hypothetical protein
MSEPLPPPLPPERRTVGQLVAESIQAYRGDFWRCLPLGLPLAVADQLSVHETALVQSLIYWVTTPLFAAAYIWACRIVLGARQTRTAVVLALVIWLPFPLLRAFYILPGLAWLALMGLAVPVAMVERAGFRAALIRGRQLALSGYAHALGSLSALVVVVGIAANVLSALLHSQGDAGQRVAVFASELVLSPLLYLGGALLYTDQAARHAVRSGRAALHPPLDAEPAGRPDAQVEP